MTEAPRYFFEHAHQWARAAWRRRYVIALPIVFAPFIGLAVGLIAPERYEARMTVLVQEAAKLNPFLQDLTVTTNLKARMDALTVLLHSRHVLSGVALDLGWIHDETEEDDRARAISLLSERLSVRLVGTELIELRYRAPEPERMDEVLSLVASRFLEQVLAPEKSSISDSVVFLRRRLDMQRGELAKAERILAEFKAEHASELPELLGANVRRLTELRAKLGERQTALAGAKAGLESLRLKLARTNPVVGAIEEAIVQSSAELTLLSSRYTERHSKVRTARRKLARLREERRKLVNAAQELKSEDIERLWNIATVVPSSSDATVQPLLISQFEQLQAARGRVASLEQEMASLEQATGDLEARFAGRAEVEERLMALDRNVRVKRELHESLMKRFEMARVTRDLSRFESAERVKIIDEPSVPTASSNPSLLVFIATGLLAGIALGSGLALVLELLDNTVYRREQVERILGTRLLSRIPVLPNEGFATDGRGMAGAPALVVNGVLHG